MTHPPATMTTEAHPKIHGTWDILDLAPGLGFFFGGARPPTKVTVTFIDADRSKLGAERICKTPQMTPGTYHAAKHRSQEPSELARRDAVVIPILMALWVADTKAYGVHRLWKAASWLVTTSAGTRWRA